jgi:hypothetical protein
LWPEGPFSCVAHGGSSSPCVRDLDGSTDGGRIPPQHTSSHHNPILGGISRRIPPYHASVIGLRIRRPQVRVLPSALLFSLQIRSFLSCLEAYLSRIDDLHNYYHNQILKITPKIARVDGAQVQLLDREVIERLAALRQLIEPFHLFDISGSRHDCSFPETRRRVYASRACSPGARRRGRESAESVLVSV